MRTLRALTTRTAQIADICKRLVAQLAARKKQDILAFVEGMDDALKTMLDTQIGELERRIESVIAQKKRTTAKARLPRPIPGIGPISAALPIAETPELGRMAAGTAMTGLADVPDDSETMRGWGAIAGGWRALRQVLF